MNSIHHYTYSLFRKIKSKIDRRLNSILIPFLVKYEMVNLLCWLLIFSLKKIKKVSPINRSKYKVIVLNKGGGTDDLIQSQKNIIKISHICKATDHFLRLYTIQYLILKIKEL